MLRMISLISIGLHFYFPFDKCTCIYSDQIWTNYEFLKWVKGYVVCHDNDNNNNNSNSQ